MKKTLDKIYDPKQFEDKIYHSWMQSGYFHADAASQKPAFSIVIPPPNITGQLHMGHALDETLQDILVRFKRMQGFEVLWLPGTDHASIATEVKISEALREEGTSKEQIGREAFLKRAWDWKKTYGGRIVQQLQKIGCSCDWQRERFTLDDGCNQAVNEMFVRLYEKGLIYRGERIIHWCPKCKTSLSDAEVEYREQQGSLWRLRYPLADGSAYLDLATTRPETMLGDTAVAVHPDDPRYRHLIGKTVFVPLAEREVPIVADSYVDMEFGTGVVKITPAHDPNDFEVGLRHNLPIITVLTDDAKMTSNCGKYAGMDRYEARKQIVADLQELGSIVEIQPHVHNVGECYRCGETLEPRVSKQWFVKMKSLAEPAIEMVKSGEVQFVPKRFEKMYFHWMENIRDWCISRQLWWGHRIPVWYCDDCGEMMVSRTAPTSCSHCSKTHLRQDPDTLDTWFSSALWPFSTMGWPKQTEELKRFYPTSALVTGYDIITFWVSRMVTAAAELTGQAPFGKVLIHGLVRDEQGRKMSKSLGNGIDPLKVAKEYGADALRFMLASGTNAGNDMRYSEEKVVAARNFANKLWNASRFVLMNLSEDMDLLTLPTQLCAEDYWVLTQMNQLVREVTLHLENYDISVASQKIYDFTWNVLCDWYIELCKTRLQGEGEQAQNAQTMLVYLLTTTLQLLHPFMPFITEEIFLALPRQDESIMISRWPEYRSELNFAQESTEFEKIIDAIKGIRNVRSEMKVPPSRKVTLYIQTDSAEIFKQCRPFFERLAGAQSVEIGHMFDIADAVQVATDAARIFIPMDDLIDREKETERLKKEQTACENEIAGLKKKLSNQSFVEKAPAAVVDKEREKLKRAEQKLEKIGQSLQTFLA